MTTRIITWAEATELFERRGLPKSTWENLYDDGDYVLHSGDATVDGHFPLNDGMDHPWGDDGDLGYIVDGDLTVSGSVYDEDDGASALVVLGDLRVGAVDISCDPKIVVTGDTTAGVFYSQHSGKYLAFHGDLTTTVLACDGESAPDHVGGTLTGTLVLPSWTTEADLPATTVENPARPLTDLLVPEVLSDGALDGEALHKRLVAGEPVLLGP